MPSDGSACLFKRDHHKRIAAVLQSLNSELLTESQCWFGGGTAIVLARNDSESPQILIFWFPTYPDIKN